MENDSYNSYPKFGNSSPRSREIDFENPPPWGDQQLPYKPKFMCSYGGKIHPRSHDNQLSYVGGETKILTVDRTIKFSAFLTKLSTLCDSGVTFKYQLPGEDLDALISVTNDDDLDHMMHEFDRLNRSSGKQARIRLFLFPFRNQSFGGRSDSEQFAEDLNSVPDNVVEAAKPPVLNNVDFLFGLNKVPSPPPVVAQLQDQVPEPVASPREFSLCPVSEDRVCASNSIVNLNQIDIPRHMQEFQRLQINLEHEQGMYTRKSAGNQGCYSGDYYVQNLFDKTVPTSVTGTPAFTASAGYLPEKHISNGGFPVTMTTTTGAPPEAYILQAPGTFFHAPGTPMRPVTLQATNQAFYTTHRIPSDPYREHQIYNIMSHPAQPPLSAAPQSTLPPQPSRGATAFSKGISVIRPNNGGGNISMVSDTGPYTQVAYDSATGRQVYYTVAGGMMFQAQVSAPYPAIPVAGSPGGIGQYGQFVAKALPGSV